MKSILISIKPKWVAKILNGEKTIEIHKTMPKCVLPIDVYIYCTKDKELLHKNCANIYWVEDKDFKAKNKRIGIETQPYLNGKVVAKFTLNKVEKVYRNQYGINTCITDTIVSPEEFEKMSCLKGHEIYCNYLYGKDRQSLFAWHIDNLVIFDEPMELSEFYGCKIGWNNCAPHNCKKCPCKYPLVKAPQSWCYIESEELEIYPL